MRLTTIVATLSCVSTIGVAASAGARAQNTASERYDAPQAFWSTPGDGRLILLLRNAKDERVAQEPTFVTPVPYRVRVCVTTRRGSRII